jgi:hypothetical protein
VDPFLVGLAVKLASAALVVVLAAMIVERAGPFLGAMVVTLPIAAGPAYVFLALELAPAALAESALSSLVANAATALYMTVYALLAQRHGILVSLGSAAVAWVGIVAVTRLHAWTLPQAIVLNILLYWPAWELLRRLPPPPAIGKAAKRWWDIPLRALMVMSLAAAVIFTARLAGPGAAGLVALAPIGFSSMAIVLHGRLGGRASAAVYANAMPGMVGFGIVVLVVHLAVERLGSWPGLGLALATSLAWNAGLIIAKTRFVRP